MRRVIVFLIAAVAAVQLAAAPKSPKMTNDDVIALVQAGLSDGVVIEKIRTSATQFDTSTEALVRLKKAGVADGVIRLIVNPNAKAEAKVAVVTDTPAPCQAPANGPAPWLTGSSPAMWVIDDTGERSEIMYERGNIHMVGFAGIGARLLILKPIRASLRLKSHVVFQTCINPTDAPLVKFSVDKDDDERNTSVGKVTPFNMSFRISEDDLVPMTFQKTPQGFFEIRPRAPLQPGEYGFVPQASVGYFTMGERVYTFGVD